MSESLSSWTGQPVQTQWTKVFSASKKKRSKYLWDFRMYINQKILYTNVGMNSTATEFISISKKCLYLVLSFYLANKIACFRQILDYIEKGTYKKIMTVIHGGVQSQFIMNYVIWIPE